LQLRSYKRTTITPGLTLDRGTRVVRALRAYDSTGGTSYSDDLRAMYFQFASALATHDGPPTSGELNALSALSNALRDC
jgi:hypothetical protein